MGQQHSTGRACAAAIRPWRAVMRRGGRALAASLLLFTLAGCKVLITVPEGGRVVGTNGTVCLAGEACEIDISNTSFHHTFTAHADPGYRFTGWARAEKTLCSDHTGSCLLTTVGFAGDAWLEAILASDQSFDLLPQFVAEADPSRYDPAEWAQLLDSLNSSWHRSDAFLYQQAPNVGSCDPGSLSSAAGERLLYAVNLIRKLHYLPPVQYDSSFAAQAQQAALVQLANDYLTHSPSPGDTCYSEQAAAGAGSSNLSYRSGQSDPAYYALGLVNDNFNVSNVMQAGHRRWILYTQLGYTTFGQARGYAAMKVFGFNQAPEENVDPALEYVAYPYRRYPYYMVSSGGYPTPWSISMIPAPGMSSRFDHFSAASVSVVETATGTPLHVHSQASDTRGYGLANNLAWMVDGWEHDTPYTVTISNVRMQDGSTRTVQYPVEIDYEEYL